MTTTISSDTLFIAVINTHPQNDIKTNIKVEIDNLQTQAKIYELTSNHYLDFATPDEPDKISPTNKDYFIDLIDDGNSFYYTFPKHSLTIIAIPGNYDSVGGMFPEYEVNLFPNPTTNTLNISFDKYKRINNIKIYDVLGRLVYYRN